MTLRCCPLGCFLVAGALGIGLSAAASEQGADRPRLEAGSDERPLSLAAADDAWAADAEEQATGTAPAANSGGYLGVSEFFNIREANPNVGAGGWELRLPAAWNTRSDGRDDNFLLGPALKYGITDDLFVGLELAPLNLGDSRDQGNGDLNLLVHWRLLRENDTMPAVATWARMRIPSGQGSRGVDGEFHGTITKTIVGALRAHLDGFVMTANGERTAFEDDRRHFQWGVGPGFDYALDDQTLLLLNYLHRSSNLYGNHNINLLEIGVNRQLSATQAVKAAIDIGLDDGPETPNFGAKLEWSLTLR